VATAQQLEELVSPIALYPDVLIAQVLAGSTYPTQVVEADQWLKANSKLSSDQLAAAVNAQQWDPSIKSLTQFPPVLNTMSESLAWTSALGEAYYNQPADVMNAIQSLRNRAVGAGTLKSTSELKVEVQPAPAPAAVQGGTADRSTADCNHSACPAQHCLRSPVQPRNCLRRARTGPFGIHRDRNGSHRASILWGRDGDGRVDQ
jgi:hypothetical protein